MHCAACPGFVEFVERGDLFSDQIHVLAERFLSPLKRRWHRHPAYSGCTHYPFLARTIADVMGRDQVVLVSCADETAFDVRSASLSTTVLYVMVSLEPVRHRFSVV